MTNVTIEQLKKQGFRFIEESNEGKLYTIIKPNHKIGAEHVNSRNLARVANSIDDAINEFNKSVMIDTIQAAISDGINTFENIQDYTTNYEPWIIGTYKAAKALEMFDESDQLYTETMLDGVFGAIEYVQAYEKNEFGEVNTDLGNPEDLASAVAYINMQQVIGDVANALDIDCDDELTDEQKEKIMHWNF